MRYSPYCEGCDYAAEASAPNGCNYIIVTGVSRGCPPGEGCIHKKVGGVSVPVKKEWDKKRAKTLLLAGGKEEAIAKSMGVSVSEIHNFKLECLAEMNEAAAQKKKSPRRKKAPTVTTPPEPPAAPAPPAEPEPSGQPQRPERNPVDIRIAAAGWSVGLNAPNSEKAYEALRQMEKALNSLWRE